MICDNCGNEFDFGAQLIRDEEFYDCCRQCFIDEFLFKYDEVPSE